MIDRSLSERPWPSYYPHAGDTLIAVGTIALNYGLLETQLKNVFCAATGMSYAQLNAFFHRIPNDKRRDALEELRDDAKLPDALTTAITRFLDYFEVCADNRHSVMHAFASGEYIDANICDRGLLLSKYSKSGKRLYCQAKNADLRGFADDIHATMKFGSSLYATINTYKNLSSSQKHQQFLRLLKPPECAEPQKMRWSHDPTPAKPKLSRQPEPVRFQFGGPPAVRNGKKKKS